MQMNNNISTNITSNQNESTKIRSIHIKSDQHQHQIKQKIKATSTPKQTNGKKNESIQAMSRQIESI